MYLLMKRIRNYGFSLCPYYMRLWIFLGYNEILGKLTGVSKRLFEPDRNDTEKNEICYKIIISVAKEQWEILPFSTSYLYSLCAFLSILILVYFPIPTYADTIHGPTHHCARREWYPE